MDATHMEGLLHYSGEAIPIMTRELTDEQVAKLVTDLMQTLGLNYDVIKENNDPKGDHIHI